VHRYNSPPAQTVHSTQAGVTRADANLASDLIASGVTTQSIETVMAVLVARRDGASTNAADRPGCFAGLGGRRHRLVNCRRGAS
jgi:hypothetical protein